MSHIAVDMIKCFPVYSTNHFFLLATKTLLRFDVNLMLNHIPARLMASPNEVLYRSKLNFTDFVQCTESHIAILLAREVIVLIDQFTETHIYKIIAPALQICLIPL